MEEEKKGAFNPLNTEADMRAKMEADMKEIGARYDELFEQLDKGDYFKQAYAPGSTVVIPGKLFSSFVNFVNAEMQTMHSMQSTLQILMNTGDAIINNVSSMTISLMEQHKENVDNGITVSGAELDKLDAKELVVEVDKDGKPIAKKAPAKKKASAKKAMGSSK
jgi:hypothetical protein|tara:strand:+ start:869 stop:1360 length:492 start_codon:yes stop_codon:yes gene_type:complete